MPTFATEGAYATPLELPADTVTFAQAMAGEQAVDLVDDREKIVNECAVEIEREAGQLFWRAPGDVARRTTSVIDLTVFPTMLAACPIYPHTGGADVALVSVESWDEDAAAWATFAAGKYTVRSSGRLHIPRGAVSVSFDSVLTLRIIADILPPADAPLPAREALARFFALRENRRPGAGAGGLDGDGADPESRQRHAAQRCAGSARRAENRVAGVSLWGRVSAASTAFMRADGGQSYTDAVFSAFDSIAGVNSLIRGAVAAVEIVSGRVERLFSRARVDGGPLARRVLTPDVLGDIGRGLVERGESLHLLDMGRDGSVALVPAEWSWDIAGEANPATWVIGASVPSPSGTQYVRRPIGSWLFCMGSRTPWRPYRGVAALYRARLTWELAGAAEDALLREMRMPAKGVYPLPRGTGGDAVAAGLRVKFAERIEPLIFPDSTQQRSTEKPQTDWKVQRIQPAPTEALVTLARDVQNRVIAAIGGHPAIAGVSGSGGADREARKQLMELLVRPLAARVEWTASQLLEEPVKLKWSPQDDVLLVRWKAAQIAEAMGMPMDKAIDLMDLR